jgi:hypothetical protein
VCVKKKTFYSVPKDRLEIKGNTCPSSLSDAAKTKGRSEIKLGLTNSNTI